VPDHFYGSNRLPEMALRVLGQVNDQAENGTWQFAPAYGTVLVKRIGIELAELFFRRIERLVDPAQQLFQSRAGFRFPVQRIELRLAQLMSNQVSRKAVNASGEVLQMESDRSGSIRRLRPELFFGKVGGVPRQIFTHLRKRKENRHHCRVDACDRSTEPGFG